MNEDDMPLKAIVTGGVRGIGGAVSAALIERGVEVIAVTHSRSADSGRAPSGLSTECIDLSTPEGLELLSKKHADADILVNNAGQMYGFPVDKYGAEEREHILALNLIAPIELMHSIGSAMAARGSGRIVNNTSIAAHIGHPDVWYGATKAGLLNATKSFARSLGPRGVVVNAVAAGPTDTDMLLVIPEERKAAMRAASILGRFAKAEEVASAVVWLALDSPPYINGACVDINNGSFMR